MQKFNSTYITYFLLYNMSTHALARGHYRYLLDSLSREPVVHQISLYLTMKVYLCHKRQWKLTFLNISWHDHFTILCRFVHNYQQKLFLKNLMKPFFQMYLFCTVMGRKPIYIFFWSVCSDSKILWSPLWGQACRGVFRTLLNI